SPGVGHRPSRLWTPTDCDSSKDVPTSFVPSMMTALQPRLHVRSTHVQLFLAEISVAITSVLCAFTVCLRLPGGPRRPDRMETGVRCSPGLTPPPFGFRHLPYATSCRTQHLHPI